MKNPIVLVVVSAVALAVVSGIVVAVIGLWLGWKTPVQFSDGFFWAGAIELGIAGVNLMGMFSQRTVAGLQYSQSSVHLDASERFRIWQADITHGYNLLGFFAISGFLLFGMSALALAVGKAF